MTPPPLPPNDTAMYSAHRGGEAKNKINNMNYTCCFFSPFAPTAATLRG